MISIAKRDILRCIDNPKLRVLSLYNLFLQLALPDLG